MALAVIDNVEQEWHKALSWSIETQNIPQRMQLFYWLRQELPHIMGVSFVYRAEEDVNASLEPNEYHYALLGLLGLGTFDTNEVSAIFALHSELLLDLWVKFQIGDYQLKSSSGV